MAPTITPYNFANITNSSENSFLSLIRYTSNATNYIPGLVILLMISLIIFFSLLLRGVTPTRSITAAMWVNLVIAVLLFPLHVISAGILVFSIVAAPLTLLLLFLFESGP